MVVANWLAASAGSAANAGQVNQFLGTHTSTWLYAGVSRASQSTGSGVYSSTTGQYLAQSFTTGSSQTTVGAVYLQVSTVGGSPVTASIAPLALSLYASSAGAPAGTALGSVALNEQYVYSSSFWVQFPLAVTGLSPGTTYQLVLSPVGTASAYYAWQHSNQTSGASVSTDASTWNAQTYGLMYQVYDQGTSGQVQYLYEDSGARWTHLTYDAFGRVATITEYTTAQNPASPFQSTRTLSYTNGSLTGVS